VCQKLPIGPPLPGRNWTGCEAEQYWTWQWRGNEERELRSPESCRLRETNDPHDRVRIPSFEVGRAVRGSLRFGMIATHFVASVVSSHAAILQERLAALEPTVEGDAALAGLAGGLISELISAD
jgi:hypothetical protein